MPVEFLTDAEAVRYGRYSGPLSRPVLEKLFYLDDEDKRRPSCANRGPHMSTVTSPDVTIIDYARYGDGPAAMAAIAPTLIYDLTIPHQINVDQGWRGRWAGISVPAIVCSGDQTFPGLRDDADAVAAALPNASRRTLPGQSHRPAAEPIVPVLAEFLRS